MVGSKNYMKASTYQIENLLKQNLNSIEFTCNDYRDINCTNSLIYCDHHIKVLKSIT